MAAYTRGILAFFAIAIALAAQNAGTPEAPAFEVISIREVPPNTPPLMRDRDFTAFLPGGQFVDPRTALKFLIALAYDVKNPSAQLLGLPKWADDRSYAISAKPGAGFPALPPSENRRQVCLMLRAMLADRFQLRVRSEIRQEPVFHLEVAKGGLKIKEVEPPVPPAKAAPVGAAMGNVDGRMIGEKSTMTSLASVVALFLKRPVIDRTGLPGHYDFDIRWKAPETTVSQHDANGFGADGAALLISALQDQLGLRLVKSTGPVEYWIVDHVEPPTGN